MNDYIIMIIDIKEELNKKDETIKRLKIIILILLIVICCIIKFDEEEIIKNIFALINTIYFVIYFSYLLVINLYLYIKNNYLILICLLIGYIVNKYRKLLI